MSDRAKPSEDGPRFVVPPPRVTLLGLAWLVAVFAVCNAWALVLLRPFATAGRPAAEVDRVGTRLLAGANALALAAALYVYCRPRIGRGMGRGWTGRAAGRTLWRLVALLLYTAVLQGLAEPDALRESARGYMVWVGIAGAAICTAWGLTVAVRSTRGPRNRNG